MKQLYVSHVAALLQVKDWQVENCAELFAEGCTIPFISRYRKERTGGLTDVEVLSLNEHAFKQDAQNMYRVIRQD